MSDQEEERDLSRDDVEAAFDEVEPDFDENAPAAPVEPVVAEGQTNLTMGLEPDPVPEEPKTANAPQSWGIAEREAWAGLDPAVQAQINKRESEINQALSYTGEARQFHESFDRMIQPYQALIAAEGSNPLATVDTMLQTVAGLMTGTPGTKAQLIADAIKQYGVDIHQLDSLLAGEMPQEDPNSQVQALVQQQLAPVQQYINQQQQWQQQQQQQQYQSTQNEIAQFIQTHEFANDVSAEMADLMQMSAQRGHNMSLDEAYEKAIAIRPDVQQVIQQRMAAGNAQQNNQTIAQKRQAAVSVPGGNQLQGSPPAPTSMRDQIAAAIDNRS